MNAFTTSASGRYRRGSSLEVSEPVSSSGTCPSRSGPSWQVSMTVLPASASVGRPGNAPTGTATTTRSPASDAAWLAAADARGPSAATGPSSVCGTRELLRTTSWPASTASRARQEPI